MRTNPYQTYLENEILSASPIKLIQIMYAAALDSIAAARRHVKAGDIRARSCAITKSMRIINELSRCLNRDAGGELSRNLASIYNYALRLLLEANAKQTEGPLVEAERLLATLADAWSECTADSRGVKEVLYSPQAPAAAEEELQAAW